MVQILKQILGLIFSNERVLRIFKLLFQYSFVIWFGIIGYIGYQFYKEFQDIRKEKETLLKDYRSKKGILTRQKKKLELLQSSYQVLKDIFSPEQVKQIKEELNRALAKVYLTSLSPYYYSLAPYSVDTFNFEATGRRGRFTRRKAPLIDLPVVSLKDLEFQSDATEYYADYLNKLLEYHETGKYKNLDVKLTSSRGYLVLYASISRDESIVKGKPTKNVGYISNVFKFPTFITTAPMSGLKNQTKVYFGWFLELQEEGLR